MRSGMASFEPGGVNYAREAPMFPFDVILFDVGGVLLTNGWDHRERADLAARFQFDLAEFERRHPEPNDRWERGEITARQYLDATLFYEPRSFSHEAFLDAICAQSRPLPGGALGILEEIAASDKCMLGYLNNEARETNDYRFGHYRLRQFIRVAFSSCYVGLRKPGTAIYRRALDILGVPPGRVLFIDDRPENLAGAETAGIRTLHFTGAEALRPELVGLGVLK
jgi:putative hydrolase of the HAD superfamily